MLRRDHLSILIILAMVVSACGSTVPASPGASTATGAPPIAAAASGSVHLPTGSSVDPSGLSLASPFGSSRVGSGGSFSVAVGDGPTEVDVIDAQDRIVLMGFVRPGGGNDVSAASTATVLLYLALGGFTVPGEHFGAVIDAIAATPEADDLAATVATRLAAQPTAISDGDSGLVDAVLAARDAILAPVSARAVPGEGGAFTDMNLGAPSVVATLTVAARQPGDAGAAVDANAVPNVIVTDSGERSGVNVLPNPDGPGIVIENTRRRDVAAFVYQVGSADAAGRRTDLDAPALVGDPHAVPATRQLNVFKSTLDAFSTGGKSAWAPVFSDPIDLPLIAGSTRTFYIVVAVGPTADPLTVPPLFTSSLWFSQVDRWKAEIDKLAWRGMIGDYLIPFMSLGIFGSVYQISTASLLKFEGALRAGAQEVLSAHGITDPTSLRARVKALATLVEEAGFNPNYFRKLQAEVVEAVGEAELNAERIAAAQARFRIWSKASAILAIVDAFFSAVDIGAIAKDLVESRQAETWSVTALEPAVKISPTVGTVSTTAPSAAFSVTVKGDANARYVYRWATTGHFGTIDDYLTSGLTVDSHSDKAFYLANDPASITADLSDTITVEVYADDGSGTIKSGATPLGKGSALVKGKASQGTGSGEGRIFTSSYEKPYINGTTQTHWCATWAVVIPKIQGKTHYKVHAEGFNDTYGGLTAIDFEVDTSDIRPTPTDSAGKQTCSGGTYEVGNEIWHGVTGGDSTLGPIPQADIDQILARFAGMVVTVEASS